MNITTTSPFQTELDRKGGCVITCRLDYWEATANDWELKGSSLFQDVTSSTESQSMTLDPGIYTVVAKVFVEESVNGVFEYEIRISGTSVGGKSGDVNTTSNPHDSVTYKSQFLLTVR